MQHEFTIAIGDWSDDGHGKSNDYVFTCTHDEDAIREAYLKAARASGVGLHRGEGFEAILDEYEENTFTNEQADRLKAVGVDFSRLVSVWPDEDGRPCFFATPRGAAELFLEMARSQLPGFEYAFVEPKRINGYWGKFNESIGYGCYS